jgi:aldose 1-epimerase
MANAPPLLRLAAAPLELTLAPELGGGIARFDYLSEDGWKIPILRGVDGVPERPVDLASFPLVPYVNRVRGGRFDFRGRRVTLAQNMPPDPSPLHGQGWLGPWQVGAGGKASAELVFRHSAGEWPWMYEARQHFELDPRGLTVVLTCKNGDLEPMPCGLGQHPYFHCTAETRLDTGVESVWTIDEHVLPVEKLPAEGRFGLRNRLVCRQDLDHGFGGWNGRARVDSPDLPFAIEMSSPEAGFFQLYSPLSGEIFVAEPVTHANAALNAPEAEWADLGMRVLAPGEAMSLTMRIELLPDSA